MTKYTYLAAKKGYVIKRGKKSISAGEVTRLLNAKWGRLARQLSPKDNSIILIKKPKQQAEEEFGENLQLLADEILARLGITCFLIGVKEFSDFNTISEERMEEIGYLKSERVLAIVTESFDEINKRLEEEE